ncbi:MAG: (2Fe-2S)-binding protein [Chloroflexi bacterium]|nr:(2Fe-2S)-binding protein [Chloroflexota bacterium]
MKQNFKRPIGLKVNGEAYDLQVAPGKTLLEVIREDLSLTGTKRGCDSGDCGACTVLINGKSMLSCLVLAVEAQGKEITTIEGLAPPGGLHPIQEAFIQNGAIQCGFCTPGMILTAKALLDEHPAPAEDQIRRALSGNVCRCTGYAKIVQAIQNVAHGRRVA